MPKLWKKIVILTVFAGCLAGMGTEARAEGSRIESGVTIGDIDVSGMSVPEAESAVESFVSSLEEVPITLKLEGGKEIPTTAGAFGIHWENDGSLNEAIVLGKQGNLVQRYKAMTELEKNGRNYPLNLSFREETIDELLVPFSETYNQEAVNASLTKTSGGFQVTEGRTGYSLDIGKSKETILNYLQNNWDYAPAEIELVVTVDEPKGDAETLSKVRDVLGTFTTAFKTSGPARYTNIARGCELLNGTTVYPGEQVSVLEKVTPMDASNGYEPASSYLNGLVVDSYGGGICQVSTTLYNALIRSELQIDVRSNHSMIVSYVDPSVDAAISESGGKDLKFTNNLEYPIYIEGIINPDKTITFNVYGVETRSPNRKVEFVPEILETNVPPTETIVQTADPVGVINVQSVHIGYKARLWKIVTENGVEVSREQVNNSSYKAVPRLATVGTATADPEVAAQLQAVIATGSIDQVKAYVGAYAAAQAAAAQAAQEAAQQQEQVGDP